MFSNPDPEINGYQVNDNNDDLTDSEDKNCINFGADAADSFINHKDFDLIVISHQLVPDGYEFPFYPKPTVFTVFSAANYCDYENNGAMLLINEKLNCEFQFIVSSERS